MSGAIAISVDGQAEKPGELAFENETVEPTVPDEPDLPDEPDHPDEPDLPDEPAEPAQPSQPDSPSVPDRPSAPEKPQYHTTYHGSDTPRTGDSSRILLWGGAFALGTGLLAGGVIVWHRRKNSGGTER